MKKAFKVLSNIALSILVAVEVACLLVVSFQKISGKNPSLFGYTISIIATDSMVTDEEGEICLNVGDAILSKLYKEGMEVTPGDVLTYSGGAKPLITHKLIRIEETKDGNAYVFKGTNPIAEEDPYVYEDQLESIYICKLNVVSFIYKLTSNVFGFVLIVIVPIALIFIDELVGLIKAVKKEVSGNENEDAEKTNKDTNN